ncbi:response regulator [Brachybacterium sp. GCM10030252]|uniref:response regulator n=1 Tax=Brachybacterium sp. GCM10030252 TaxID=3273380 RepID=UPI00360C6F5C
MTRVLVVDDHPVVRDGLVSTISTASDLEVVGQAGDGPSAVDLAAVLLPDVVVMDLRMPGGGGVAAIQNLRSRGIDTPVLVLTTYDTDSDTVAAIEAGATGYLLKDASTEALIDAIRTTSAGEVVLSPAIATRLASHMHQPARRGSLSTREREVLLLVARGTSNRLIAKELFVSEATVKTHLTHIFTKLGVSDRAAAVAAAYERGILG